MPEVAAERPPYVSFEMRAIEDRTASQETGHFVCKNVAYALVTPAGSKDVFEGIADQWLSQKRIDARQGRFRPEWLEAIERGYDAWKKGLEAPINGHDLALWPVISPAQVKMLQNLNVRSVEDLAAVNEETISRMGMGGRALKQKAADWLSTAGDRGKVTEELTKLKLRLTTLEQENASLREKNARLVAETVDDQK